MLFILLGLCLTIGTTFATYKFIKNLPVEKTEETAPDLTQFDLPPAVEEEVLPPPVEEPPPPMEETIAFPEPVVEDDVVENEIAIVEDLQDTKAAETTQEGTDDFQQEIIEKKTEAVVEVIRDEVVEVDEDATFPGGQAAYAAFLQKNFRYPEIAIDEGIQGKCWVTFVVDKNGNVSDVRVAKGIAGCPECDREAVRVMQLVPKWTPGKLNGKPMKSKKSQPIVFKLEG